jgi:DNA-binding PadR family transcriptional regulator
MFPTDAQNPEAARRTPHPSSGELNARSPVFHGFVRGMLPWFLLTLLREGALHGHDLIRRIAEVHGGWKPSPGSVYPVLRRHEEDGLIRGEWRRTRGAPKRVYRLTPKGRATLPKMRKQLISELCAARDVIDAHMAMLASGTGLGRRAVSSHSSVHPRGRGESGRGAKRHGR